MDGHRAILAGTRQLPTGKSYFPGNTAFSNAFWRIAVLAAAGIVGAASPAEAAPSVFWPDYYEPVSAAAARAPARAQIHQESTSQDRRCREGCPEAAGAADHRHLDREAESSRSTTPTASSRRRRYPPACAGIRRRWACSASSRSTNTHQSNIYSGAPMPYMQRITWSGVAMHAGVLPGYPASHGCIRMPMNFAVKMWGWTRMGARVVITPGELSPESFSHPLLATQKIRAGCRRADERDVASPRNPTRRRWRTRPSRPRFQRRASN